MVGIGVPELMIPPVLQRNYGKWVSHEVVKPGVLKHVSETGDECYTVRVGMPSNARVSTKTMLNFCDLADKYTQGYFRLTQRHALEFVGVPEEEVGNLIRDIETMGYIVGGVDRTLHNIVACAGWFHCQLGATDPMSLAHKLNELFVEDFRRESLPAKLKISITACPNNCGEGITADIGIIGIHRDIPRVIKENLKECELPLVVSVCPTAAIRPKGRDDLQINPERCMHCGSCYMTCPALPIGNAETDGVGIFIGGKAGSSGKGPTFAKLVVPYLPNRPPQWTEVVDAVKKIVEAWKRHARDNERIADWIERIGWEGFFRVTGIKVTMKSVDHFVFALERSLKDSARFRW
jgi:sulfite reductase beta subunit